MADQQYSPQTQTFAYPSQMQDANKALASIASLLQGGTDKSLYLISIYFINQYPF